MGTGAHNNTSPAYNPYLMYHAYQQASRADEMAGGEKVMDFVEFTATNSAGKLSLDADDLDAEVDNILAIEDGAFGSSPLGQSLQNEAKNAHELFRGAVKLLSKSMVSYSNAVKTAKTIYLDTDADAHASVDKVQKSMQIDQDFKAGTQAASTPTAQAPAVPDAPQTDPAAGGQ